MKLEAPMEPLRDTEKNGKLGFSEIDVDDPDFETWVAQYYALKNNRRKHPYVADLISLLLSCPHGLSRSMVMHDLERQRRRDGLPIPTRFEQAVQSSYNHYSVDSVIFRDRKAPDTEALFYSPNGKGSGRWAVNRERALAWLKSK